MAALLAAAVSVFIWQGRLATSAASAPAIVSSHNYIVVLNDGVADPGAVANQQARAYGGQVGLVYRHALKGYSVALPTDRVAALAANPAVRFVSEDGDVTATAKPTPCTDPTQCQFTTRAVRRVDGDLSSARSGDGKGSVSINIAVIDSGIDVHHPDLNVVGGTDCTHGANSFDDDHGHGSMVAGLIGAKDNGFGIVGVAPGARLWAVKVLNKQASGTIGAVICGIDWVTSTRNDSDANNDIGVANMSLGGKGSDDGNCGLTNKDALHFAICRSVAAGVTYVAGAGNDSADLQSFAPATYGELLTATAIADFDGQSGALAAEIAGVCSGLGSDDSWATFSNFATLAEDQLHTVAAPGVCISSTYLNADYATGNGTSFASPLAAGTVALCIASGPCAGLTPAQIVRKIVADAAAYNSAHPDYGFAGDPQHPVSGRYYGNLIRAGSY